MIEFTVIYPNWITGLMHFLLLTASVSVLWWVTMWLAYKTGRYHESGKWPDEQA